MADARDIRATIAGDAPALALLYGAAFPDEDLWPLVRRLLAEVPDVMSLAAFVAGRLSGHLLLTPCGVGAEARRAALLGPLAVAPAHQRAGLGGALIGESFRLLRQYGPRRVLVLGDPAYYGRFGFGPERAILPPYDLPADWSRAWQSLDLGEAATPLAGRLNPPAAWLSPSLWAP